MNEKIKVQPRLVNIRLYADFIIRNITTILLHIKNDLSNNTVTFITINTMTGIGKIKQRNITISSNVKFDITELDSDDVTTDIISKIFIKGYHEISECYLQRTDKQNNDTVAFEDGHVENKRIGAGTASVTIANKPPNSPVSSQRQYSPPKGQSLEDVAKRAAAVMHSVKNPHLSVQIDQSVLDNEEFDPDIQQVEVDENA